MTFTVIKGDVFIDTNSRVEHTVSFIHEGMVHFRSYRPGGVSPGWSYKKSLVDLKRWIENEFWVRKEDFSSEKYPNMLDEIHAMRRATDPENFLEGEDLILYKKLVDKAQKIMMERIRKDE